MNDIVERLRYDGSLDSEVVMHDLPYLLEAATEIESLRLQIAKSHAAFARVEAVCHHRKERIATLEAELDDYKIGSSVEAAAGDSARERIDSFRIQRNDIMRAYLGLRQWCRDNHEQGVEDMPNPMMDKFFGEDPIKDNHIDNG